jgi:hypothetical protein
MCRAGGYDDATTMALTERVDVEIEPAGDHGCEFRIRPGAASDPRPFTERLYGEYRCDLGDAIHRRRKAIHVYIGIGTVVFILLLILIIGALRRA